MRESFAQYTARCIIFIVIFSLTIYNGAKGFKKVTSNAQEKILCSY